MRKELCYCDICGKKMSNDLHHDVIINDRDTGEHIRYDDTCSACKNKILKLIDEIKQLHIQE